MLNQLFEKFFNTIPNTLAILIVVGLALLALVLAILLSFLLIRAILRIPWKPQTVKKFLKIENEGNVSEKFFLKIIVPQDDIKIECCLDGYALPVAPPMAVKKSVTSIETFNKVDALLITRDDSTPVKVAQTAPVNPEDKKKLADSAEALKKKSKKGMGFVRLFSGIIGTLGSLIPGSAGRSLKQKSTDMQKRMQDVDTKMQMPEQKLKSVDHLKGQMNQIKPGSKDNKPEANQSEPFSVASQYSLAETQPQAAVATGKIITEEDVLVSTGYLQTPPLTPDNEHVLEVSCKPVHRYRSGDYTLEVLVRQDQPEKIFSDLSETKVLGKILIQRLSPIFWILSFFMVLSVVVVNTTWAVLFINWMAKFVV
jgi:hypothetical protein